MEPVEPRQLSLYNPHSYAIPVVPRLPDLRGTKWNQWNQEFIRHKLKHSDAVLRQIEFNTTTLGGTTCTNYYLKN